MASKHQINSVGRNWGWLLGWGILLIFFGFLGLSMVIGLTLISMYFFAALLLVSAISHFIDVFKNRDWEGIAWQAIIGILYLMGACVIAYDPFLASTFITGLLAIVLIIIGLIRIFIAISSQEPKERIWLLFAGIIAMILGILILIQWPFSGLWVLGMFIAIDMMVCGWAYILIALSLRATIA